jgi:ERCC4-related helicase
MLPQPISASLMKPTGFRSKSLQVLLCEQKRHGTKLRCIVFCQQRILVHILKYVIDKDADLSSIKTAVVHATSTPATPLLRVTASEAAARLKAFKSGAVTVLLATNVAEEGMDVPAANCVVRFDEAQTAVSLVQSRGRARQVDSSFIVMKVRSLCVLLAAWTGLLLTTAAQTVECILKLALHVVWTLRFI